MPAEQRGQPYRTGRRLGNPVLRRGREAPSACGFASKTEARRWFENVERPRQHGLPTAQPDVTLSAFIGEFLTAKAATVEPITVATLRRAARVRAATAFGTVTLREFERRPTGDRRVASSTLGRLPVRGHWGAAPGARRRRPLGLLRAEPGEAGRAEPAAESTGDRAVHAGRSRRARRRARPGLRAARRVRRRDGAAPGGVDRVGAARRRSETQARRSSSGSSPTAAEAVREDGTVATAGAAHTAGVRGPREVPARLDTRLLFPAAEGGYIGLDTWRPREWYPALEAAGLAQRGPYCAPPHVRHATRSRPVSRSSTVARYTGT